jgi:hypothetical protein
MPFLMFCQIQKRTLWHVSVESDHFTVGCSRRATVTVSDPRIAAKQIVIRRRGEHFSIANLADHEEVLLNGAPVAEATITTGDRVRLGNTLMLFVAETEPSRERIERLEPVLDREIFTPACVREALELEMTAGAWNRRVLLAFAMCGAAIGVLAAIVITRLVGR